MAATAKKAAPAKKAAAKKAASPNTVSTDAPDVTPPLESASPDVKRGEEKRGEAKSAELGSAAERRANYLAALEQEREGYVRFGKDDRVKQVDAEIARVKKVKDRTDSGPSDEA